LIAAYKELENKKIIGASHGKGFYVLTSRVNEKEKVLLLFDVMNGYKEVLYRSLTENLGKKYESDIFFHYYNLKVFEQVIQDSLGKYDHYVIMPHFNIDVSSIVKLIPLEKLLIIDKDIPAIEKCKAVYQDFETDVQKALNDAARILKKKYKKVFLIINREFQFIPEGIIKGFKNFCKKENFPYGLIEDLETHLIRAGDVFIVFTDKDLVRIIKTAESQYLKPGKDIGIISYDETEMKEVLKGGITVMSTDFNHMGITAARMIQQNEIHKFPNPFYLILRKSL
ncbi:MAG: hypothetical protein ACP5E3_11520, partial [Bacteroidales bacterium]